MIWNSYIWRQRVKRKYWRPLRRAFWAMLCVTIRGGHDWGPTADWTYHGRLCGWCFTEETCRCWGPDGKRNKPCRFPNGIE